MASTKLGKIILSGTGSGRNPALAIITRNSHFLSSTPQHQHLLTNANIWRAAGSVRTLFTAEALGLDGYVKQRERSQTQFTGTIDKFREKMREFALSENKEMIFTEDLKNMLHLTEDRPDDLVLIHQMMQKFNKQNRNLRFGNFVFGPVVMRMYHHLNQPSNALEVFKDPELEGLFEQLSSYQILCDLLFRNNMYQEILDVFEIIKTRQVQGQKYPRNVCILVFAACYKLNTVQSYEYALKILTDMRDFGAEPVRRSVAYAAALAINQNAPDAALEMISSCRTANYVSIRNLKMWALAELNRPEDCLPLLRYSIEFDRPEATRRQSVFPEVLDKIALSVERLGKKDVSLEFERIHKSLVDTNQVATQKFTDLMDAEVESRPRDQQQFQGQHRNGPIDGLNERSFRIGRSLDLQPKRNPTYQREFRDRERMKYE